METKLFIPVILGTNRQGRESEKVARLISGVIGKREDIETRLFDVRDFEMPSDDYGQSLKDRFPEYKEAATRADGFIIVAPEYNRGYPGILKSVLDILLREYVHKAAGLVGVSSGSFGGARVVENLLPVVRELGLTATFTSLHFAKAGELFDERGNLKDESYYRKIDNFLEELVWMSGVLRWGRENVPSKYHQN